MRPDALHDALADDRPTIVCAQVGEVNTGSVDPLPAISGLVRERRDRAPTWLHVDGAFGLWAAAGATTRHLVDQLATADSWATDGHKWLNVPYDCGIAICADRAAMQRAMSVHGAYLPDPAGDTRRDALNTTPEFSRRARGFAVWAALRQLGRSGVAALVDDLVAMARRFRDRLEGVEGIEVVNEVVLNQVLVRLRAPDGDDDAHTARVLRDLHDDGTCVMTGTRWQGVAHVRISVSNWSTTAEDVDRAADTLIRLHRR
jgi:glutamate/tyrosine decarboxylase-like PLP-dependent enzyme